MTHLDMNTLARLLDESPSEEEAGHLSECQRCSGEFQALELQRDALAKLPGLRAPVDGWERLEAGLQAEELCPAPRRPSTEWPKTKTIGTSRNSLLIRAAAAVLLFLGGAVTGSLIGGDVPRGTSDIVLVSSDGLPADAEALSLDDAEALVSFTHRLHLEALTVYRDRLEASGRMASVADPVSRFVALENLLSATEAAVRENPADPFLNGMLVSTTAERRAVLESMSFTSSRGP